MRDLSKMFNEKSLRLLLSNLNDLDIDTEEYDETLHDELSEIVKYFGVSDLEWEEVSFFIELIRLNPNYETETIRLPKLNSYDVYFEIDMTESVVETWRHNVNSYFDESKNTLIEDQMKNHPDWSYWEGTQTDKDYFDTYVNDERVSEIRKRNK